ncbi:immunoglobulin-like domain-containing protein [Listeria booriae]|uniref:immunoglobulin-like domain-containing protein n=1 Tax=Listeria booriae TaxID=1552123 RepID=UPI001E3367CA|nr:immunoglobulin-like domain-containing protein [Listeria booriae]MCD2208045.1 DUF5011 domain-containing protein [Listeria booriae]
MKKFTMYGLMLALICITILPMGTLAYAATTDHTLKATVISEDGASVRHTVELNIEKKAREKKLDLVLVQDLSGSFKDSYPKVAEKLKEALDLLDPYLDRTQFVGFTGIKSSDEDYPLFSDSRATLEMYNQGEISEGYNVILKTKLSSNIQDTKNMLDDVVTKKLYGRSTPTAYGIEQAIKEYQANAGAKDPNRETLFLVVTDGFPNGDINGTPLTPSSSLVRLLGPTTGIIAALNEANETGYQTSFGLWQEKESIVNEWGEASYNNYNNYINDNIPGVVTRPEFFFNMTTADNSLDEYASYVRDIVQTNLNDQLSVTENISSKYTYVGDSAVLKDASGKIVMVPAPYSQPSVTNNKFEWDLDALPPGQYTLTYEVDGPYPANAIPVISAEDKTVKQNSVFNPIATILPTATDKESGNLTSKLVVKENTVDTSKPGVYKVVYQVTDTTDSISGAALRNIVDNGEIIYQNSLLQELSTLSYKPEVKPNTITKEIKVTVVSDSSIDPVPPADNDDPVPPADNDDPVPPADNDDPVPPAGNDDPVPPAGNDDPVPPAGNDNPVPPAGNDNPVPPLDNKPILPSDNNPTIPIAPVIQPEQVKIIKPSVTETSKGLPKTGDSTASKNLIWVGVLFILLSGFLFFRKSANKDN